jgi:hypothetical protein
VALFLSLIDGLMELKEEHSVLQLFNLNEGFFLESRI